MRQAFKVLVGTILLVASVVANATPFFPNLLPDAWSLRTDFGADLFYGGTDFVTYDASRDVLTFTAQQLMPGEYTVCGQGSCTPTQSQLFQWSGGVDKHGRVFDPGSFSWFADFGSGMELLGRGRLLKLGSEGIGVFEDEVLIYLSLQFLFDFDFRSSRISAETERMLLLFNRPLYTADLFGSDFACGSHVTYGLVNTNCEAWDNTGVIGQRAVPEPSALALLGLSLFVGFFFRSRKPR